MFLAHIIRRNAVLACTLMCLAFLDAAPSLATPPPRLPDDAAVEAGKLGNGFTYYLRNVSSPTVEIRLVVKTGFPFEGPGETGVAHLIEHLATKSTNHFPANGVYPALFKLGLQAGSGWDAGTGNVTTYRISLPTTKSESSDTIIALIQDWASGAQMAPSQIDIEREVVLSEFRDKSGGRDFDAIKDAKFELLDDPAYNRNFREDHDRTIKTVTPETVSRFYHKWYRPDLQAVIIVGDVNVKQMRQRIEVAFANLRNPPSPRPDADLDRVAKVSLTGHNKTIVRTDRERQKTVMQLLFLREESNNKYNVDDYRHALIETIANRALERRMAAVEDVSPSGCDKSNFAFENFWPNTGIGALSVQLDVTDVHAVDECVTNSLRTLFQLRAFGFTQDEFDLSANELIEQTGTESATSSASELADSYVANFAYAAPAPSSSYLKTLKLQLLKSISINEVNDELAKWIDTGHNFHKIFLFPEGVAANSYKEDSFTRRVAAIQAQKQQRFRRAPPPPKVLLTGGQASKIVSGTVVKRRRNGEGQTELTLKNGIEITLVPSEEGASAGQRILLQGHRPGGLGGYKSQSSRLNARASKSFVPFVGAGTFDWRQIRDFMQEHQMGSNFVINGSEARIGLSAQSNELKELLQLLHIRAASPVFTNSGFDRWLKAEQKRARSEEADASLAFDRFVKRLRFAGEEGGDDEKLTLGELETINPRSIREIYQDRFSKVADYKFVLSGPFTEAQAVPLIAKYLGSLPPKHSNVSHISSRPAKLILGKTPRNDFSPASLNGLPAERAKVRYFWSGNFQDTLENRIKLKLLAGAVDLSVRATLREQGAYSVAAGVEIFGGDRGSGEGLVSGKYSFGLLFDCAPDNVDKMVVAARNALIGLSKNGISNSEAEQVSATTKAKWADEIRRGLLASSLSPQLSSENGSNRNMQRKLLLDRDINSRDLSVSARQFLDNPENERVFVLLYRKI